MIRSKAAWIMLGAMMVLLEGRVNAITCDECRETEKNKVRIQQEITAKDQDLKTAFEKKEFQKVRDIRNRVTEMRKQLNELRANDDKCKDACRPDVVKTAECAKIREEILKTEDESQSREQIEKVDALYRDLLRCNNELKLLKKSDK
ncbi:MAG TPA: hypothetical protein VMC85_23150 [Desulfomonilaceae bacterium]|nr:hypothetical protein [Desulfomonilaceae bacterium]